MSLTGIAASTALIVLLALPASVSAGPDTGAPAAPAAQAQPPPPETGVTPDGHPLVQENGDPGWQSEWITNNLYGYDHFVQVCTYQWNDNFDDRVADAAQEWSEINGELKFSYAGWSDATCLANYNAHAVMVFVTSPPFFGESSDLGNNILGKTTCTKSIGNCAGIGNVNSCAIRLDMDNYTTGNGSYSWYADAGSPGSQQIDAESVLVHEFGHCLSAWGHSTESDSYIMDVDLAFTGSNPEGVEHDERAYAHDTELYSDLYGTTH